VISSRKWEQQDSYLRFRVDDVSHDAQALVPHWQHSLVCLELQEWRKQH
jgi:hypothetical protein